MEIAIRRALPQDREQVLAFCERTWEWGDYIGDVWEQWVEDRAGPLLVAVAGEEVAGVGKVSMPSPSEAWLEGLRVNPAFRGQGVAQALYHAAETAARQRGARVARYATPSVNEAIHHLSERYGYRRVARFIEYGTSAEAGASLPEPLHPTEANSAEVLLAASAGLAASGGLYNGGWHCRELRGGRLREHLVRGEAWVVRRKGRLAALALVSGEDSEAVLRVGFLAGDFSESSALARQLRALAHREGRPSVVAVLPALEKLEEAVRQAGYERRWPHEMWIYERRLR